MDNNTIKTMGGSLADLVKEGGDVAASKTATDILEYGAGAVSDYLKYQVRTAAILAITGTPVLTGTEETAYTGFSVSASGGLASYTYSLVGTWPDGISINASSGVVSGTFAASSAAAYAGLSVKVTDAVGSTTELPAFTITVSA